MVAAFMSPPTDQPLLKAGFKRLVYGGDEFKDVPFSAVLATAKTIREEPDLTERMVKAVVKSLYWIRANREGSIDIIMKHGRLDQREIAASLYDLMRDAFVPALDPEGVMKRAEIEIVLLKERPNFKPEQFIDDRFYKAALKALAGEPGAKINKEEKVMEAKSRSLEDIKNDIARRAGRINPFERVDRQEVEGLLGRLTSLDPDLWGSEWGKLGARHEANAEELAKLGKKEAGKLTTKPTNIIASAAIRSPAVRQK
mgnify:CR=1 FL=1